MRLAELVTRDEKVTSTLSTTSCYDQRVTESRRTLKSQKLCQITKILALLAINLKVFYLVLVFSHDCLVSIAANIQNLQQCVCVCVCVSGCVCACVGGWGLFCGELWGLRWSIWWQTGVQLFKNCHIQVSTQAGLQTHAWLKKGRRSFLFLYLSSLTLHPASKTVHKSFILHETRSLHQWGL